MPSKFFMYNYQVGDVVKLKKKHPCGSDEWEIKRVGSDAKLMCCGCQHIINITRVNLEKSTISVTPENTLCSKRVPARYARAEVFEQKVFPTKN